MNLTIGHGLSMPLLTCVCDYFQYTRTLYPNYKKHMLWIGNYFCEYVYVIFNVNKPFSSKPSQYDDNIHVIQTQMSQYHKLNPPEVV